MTKLEWTTIEASTYRSLRVRKLGSMIGDTVDMEYRISRASQAFRTMYNTWRGTIPLSTRIRIYIQMLCITPLPLQHSCIRLISHNDTEKTRHSPQKTPPYYMSSMVPKYDIKHRTIHTNCIHTHIPSCHKL